MKLEKINKKMRKLVSIKILVLFNVSDDINTVSAKSCLLAGSGQALIDIIIL